MEYVDLGYVPGEEVICRFFVEPNNISLEEAANHIAGESSIGTWTDIATMKPDIASRLKPHVYSIDKKSAVCEISYPTELFEGDNMPQILSSIAGNIYGMKAVNNLRLLDFSFPKSLSTSFKGPRYGIDGVREILDVRDRPLLGTIVKPKVGLSAKEHAEVAFNSWVGGCDIVKDDENLTNQDFNPFEERIMATLEARDAAQQETGEKKVYMPNITAESCEMMRRAEFVKGMSGRYVMIDIVTAGFSAVQSIRGLDSDLVLHAHRAMHAAYTRNKRHGLSMKALALMARYVGVDQLHIGTVVGKMEGERAEVEEIKKSITSELYGIKPVFPVCSGGLHPGSLPELISILGEDIIIQAGGGVHGHPDGTLKGAKALRQSLAAVMDDVPLNEYASSHMELKRALDKWGC
ncbi:MAG: type III ribulose-bisphosphate carboxylase [Candidatus Altiarchaeales archaeon ex4484_96]|nr:MAG: type III ribulose-bisphosphate carboxylase [Candidatus Altiarchaeales archaeon ex4484_96]